MPDTDDIQNQQLALENLRQAVNNEFPADVAESAESAAEKQRNKAAAEKALEDIASPDPARHKAGVLALFNLADSAKVGEAVAHVVAARPDGKELAKEIAKDAFRAEILKCGKHNDFLRHDHALNGFNKVNLKNLAPNYAEGVQAAVAGAAHQIGIQNMADADEATKRAAAVELSCAMINAVANTPLDQDAIDYLQGISEVANSQDPELKEHVDLSSKNAGYPVPVKLENIGQAMLNNAVVLRLGCDVALEAADKNNPIAAKAGSSLQKCSNAVDNPELRQAGLGAVKDIANAVHTPENRLQFAKLHQTLGVKNQNLVENLEEEVAQNPPNQAMSRINDRNREIQEQEAQGQGQNVQPAPQSPVVEGAGKKSRFASVRDSLASGANRLKNAVGNKLENKGKEQKLGDVAPDKVELYKSMREALKEMERLEGEAAIDAAIDAAMSSRQGTKNFQNPQIPNTIENLKAEIASMEKNDPGLKQLGRGKVGQVVHSKIRDAAKAVGSKLKA